MLIDPKEMKSATLFAAFFLFAFISPTLADEVVDTDGNRLRNGGTYYILPADFEASGGGIERIATGRERCPLTVVQSPSERSKGLPITISSPARIGIIREDFPFAVKFDSPAPSACGGESSTWTVVKGGQEEVPSVKLAGSEETRGSFRIETAGLGYKLVYCYDYSYERRCSHVAIHVDDDGNRRLVANNQETPFVVKFKRASSRSSSA